MRCRGTVRTGECIIRLGGVEKDDKEARKWYEAAATQGNVTAQYMTGRLYAALSYNVAAVKWYTKAAEQECPEAQYELGVCYEAGDASARTRQRPQNCTARRQCRAMRKRRTNSASATTMEVAWQLMKMKLRSGIRKPQKWK
mgnify:CR=1 FL=1